MVDWRKLITELSVVGITIKNMKGKKLVLKLIIGDKSIFYHWSMGVKHKIEGILENRKATKKEILEELKQVYKLFK